jgi:hypothetical protein
MGGIGMALFVATLAAEDFSDFVCELNVQQCGRTN